ncbi:hypothetical protein GXP67_11800 [Rhodocytophaga rosea]|uniref:Uncharacterized protein n=1 Tax=Rhodocytophaga rosea TaxID=2704465 RepID=A0A6C0GGV9_9BACT|nr:hypothetical protein [Rhodocytophaga rosea]QHT67271.1 hypothetical protein GXP67_11800 [Rhodocytophaga rosea]
MKAKVIVRIAALLILVHLLGHTMGHFTWDTPEDTKMKQVVEAMKTHKADFMGAAKSMADYYTGYSLMILGLFAMSILLLWFISGFINDQRQIANRLLYPIGIVYILFGIIEYLYFFPFAASMSFIAGILYQIGRRLFHRGCNLADGF